MGVTILGRIFEMKKQSQLFGTLALVILASHSLNVFAEDAKTGSSDTDKLKVGTLLQTWLVNDTTGNTAGSPNFRIRRAEVRVSGNVVENANYFVMGDLSKGPTSDKILQDLGVSWMFIPSTTLVVGQFKTQTTAESLDKASELWFAERSFEARFFGDVRETGAMLMHKMEKFQISAMFTNGMGPNRDDTNAKKNVYVRASGEVMGVTLGAFTSAADYSYNNSGAWGLNAGYKMDDLSLRAEYARGHVGGGNTQFNGVFPQGAKAPLVDIKPSGLSADVAYMWGDFQPAFRFDMFKMDSDATTTSTAETVGLNYYIGKHNFKIQTDIAYLNNFVGNNGSYIPGSDGTKGLLWTFAFQAAM